MPHVIRDFASCPATRYRKFRASRTHLFMQVHRLLPGRPPSEAPAPAPVFSSFAVPHLWHSRLSMKQQWARLSNFSLSIFVSQGPVFCPDSATEEIFSPKWKKNRTFSEDISTLYKINILILKVNYTNKFRHHYC